MIVVVVVAVAASENEFAFLFCILFLRCFSKKHGQFPGCIVHEKSELSIWYRLFFGVFSYVFRISHRFLLCFHNISGQHGTDPQRFVHATLDFYLYWTSLQRWGGGEGGYGGGG